MSSARKLPVVRLVDKHSSDIYFPVFLELSGSAYSPSLAVPAVDKAGEHTVCGKLPSRYFTSLSNTFLDFIPGFVINILRELLLFTRIPFTESFITPLWFPGFDLPSLYLLPSFRPQRTFP